MASNWSVEALHRWIQFERVQCGADPDAPFTRTVALRCGEMSWGGGRWFSVIGFCSIIKKIA
jgi:hypothetical protein